MTILIDGNNLMHIEMGIGAKPGSGHPIRSLYNKLSTYNDLTIIVWDGYDSRSRRQELFPDYKMQRGEKGEDVYAMFKLFQNLMLNSSAMQISVPTWEADDVIFTLAKYFSSTGDQVVIHTNDADYLQMADLPGISLPYIRPWAWGADLLTTYKAIVGDPADNIPGMPGFGEGSWGHVRTYHETLREALSENNWALWQTIPFPKRCQRACMDKGNFDKCVLFFKVVTMMDVPIDDIIANQKLGTHNPVMAEQILRQYLL